MATAISPKSICVKGRDINFLAGNCAGIPFCAGGLLELSVSDKFWRRSRRR
ncbi:hypothetical protein [Kamptonema formosum]|uniref:hypothetical protein n=1 Tax=Kamptonema formosum TaxID=331992 RepID=UPI0012DC3395|nr:hypothetical protein [Oscillatoria sp. PCC 10802]